MFSVMEHNIPADISITSKNTIPTLSNLAHNDGLLSEKGYSRDTAFPWCMTMTAQY